MHKSMPIIKISKAQQLPTINRVFLPSLFYHFKIAQRELERTTILASTQMWNAMTADDVKWKNEKKVLAPTGAMAKEEE